MNENEDQQPVTPKYLLKFTKEYILPEMRTIVEDVVEEKTKKFRDEILTSNDKLSVKLDKILKEQAAITVSYKRLQKRIDYLEAVVKVLAEKEGIAFNLNQDI